MNEISKPIEIGLDLIKDFLEKLAGPAAEEIGLMLQDQVKLYRFKNQYKILTKAKKFLEDKNIEPKPIPLRTLIPLLEGASLEDNDYLADKWAALISNAASSSLNKENHPSFSKILTELSPIDAILFDEVSKISETIIWNDFKNKFAEKHSLNLEDVVFSYENLFRLGLVYNTNNGLKKSQFGKSFYKICKND